MPEFIIDENSAMIRIDKFLKDKLENISRTQIASMIDDGLILVNFNKIKPSYVTKEKDVITVNEREIQDIDIVPKDLGIKIMYEDSDLAVIYKEEGMVVHPGSGTGDETLVNGLLYQINDLSSINGKLRPGIVHRIDKDTTGLLLVAKNDKASLSLSEQLKAHTVMRRYQAIVCGVIKEEIGKITAPIGRDPSDRKKMAVVAGGKDAITNFTVLKRLKDFTLIECALETGRTHQIRVHMAYIGYPIYGDKVYGIKKYSSEHGQYLHAKKIGFIHPTTGKYIEFDSEVPDYFQKFIEENK